MRISFLQGRENVKKCPECGAEGYHPEGTCFVCPECGYSPCG